MPIDIINVSKPNLRRIFTTATSLKFPAERNISALKTSNHVIISIRQIRSNNLSTKTVANETLKERFSFFPSR